MRRWAVVAAVVLVIAAVGAGVAVARSRAERGPSPSRAAADRSCPELEAGPPIPRLPSGQIRLDGVGSARQPTAAVFAPDGSGDGFLAERLGRVRRISQSRITAEVVLDLRDDTMDEGDGGLLALAYAPDGRWLYAYRANAERDDVVMAFPLGDGGQLDPTGGREILVVDHPDSMQHHGGALAFGPDGMLYIGFGDGGGLGDPRGNAQNPAQLLGKILRIDPTPGDDAPYRVPADNPFRGKRRTAPEIWSLGVRNPFRLALDPATGDLWLGDVGQSCWEELDRLKPGAGGSNLGWDHLEGTHRFEGGEVLGRRLDPEQEHPHREGWCGIVAGYVVRDPSLPSLDGRLLYTDYCKGAILALAVDSDAPGESRLLDTGLRFERPTAIVPGPHGNPWVLSLEGAVSEIVPTGA